MKLRHLKQKSQRRTPARKAADAGAANEAFPGQENAPAERPPYEREGFEKLKEPVFIHDREFRILRCNSAYAACAGLPIGEIVGKPYWQIFPKLANAPGADAERSSPGAETAEFADEKGRFFVTHEIDTYKPSGEFWYSRHVLEDVTERKTLEKDLRREKALFDAVIDSAPNAFFLVTEDAKLVRWNSYVRRESGLTDDELRGQSVLSIIHEDDRPLAAAKLLAAFATGYAQVEARVLSRERGLRVFLTTARRLALDGLQYVAGFCVDITDRKQAEVELAEHSAFADILIESVPGAFYVVDSEGNYFRWNSFLNKLTGLSDRELKQRSSLLTIQEDDRPLAAATLRKAFDSGYARATLHVVTLDRGVRNFLMTARRFQVADKHYLVGVGVDTTDQVAALKELEREAHTDHLTQVANRGYFLEVSANEFARCRRYGHALSVWMLDIDHFKAVNDTYGHQAGDTVLKSLVATCARALRDWDMMGRMGGEEFAVLLPETDAQQAQRVAERLRQMVADAETALEQSESVRFTISLGIATAQAGDADVEAVLVRADEALYEAKRTGRNKVCAASGAGEAPAQQPAVGERTDQVGEQP